MSKICTNSTIDESRTTLINNWSNNNNFLGKNLSKETKISINLSLGFVTPKPGLDNIDNEIELFSEVTNPSFSQTNFQSFWKNTYKYDENNLGVYKSVIRNFTTVIDNINRFINDNVSNPKTFIKDNEKGGIITLYEEILNPYINYIIDNLFCSKYIQLSGNINDIYSKNLLLLLNGAIAGNIETTRGAGTLRLCEFCNQEFNTYKDVFNSLSQNNNEYYQKFCGCCSILNTYYPKIYDEDGANKPPLYCLPICHSVDVVKAVNGSGLVVNNGYPNNKNTLAFQNQLYDSQRCLNQTVCVIDNININIVGGNSQVNFNQICPGCAGTDSFCSCYTDFTGGNPLDTVNDGSNSFQSNVIINQNCKNNFCVHQHTVNGKIETVTIPCNTNNNADTNKNNNQNYNHNGKLNPNSSQAYRDIYTFGIQNWLLPVIFFSIAVIVIICLMMVNVISIKDQEIYLMKEKGVS